MMVRFRNTLLATTALMPLGIVAAAANPLGSQVVGGTANVQGQGTSAVTVTQSTDKAIINWQSFNIGSGETTQFVQPNASSVTLNRVTGNMGASAIDGTLTANGRIFLVNPDGILFGAGSKINTGSFLATTNDIRNADFMAGRYQFGIPGRPDASIVNLGTITAQNGGFAALVAPGVRNTGTITANFGTVGLAAGNNFSLDFYGDRLITLGVNDSIAAKVIDVATGKPLNALVQNDGKLKGNGGRVELTAAAARQVVDSVINNSGVIEANSIGSKNGMIVLGAATAASKSAGAPTQTIKVSGPISAAGKRKNTKGGTIVVSGEKLEVTGAKIDASGDAGGGKVMLGGDWAGGNPTLGLVNNQSAVLESYQIANATTLRIDTTTTINASATSNGNGGKVILWSDQKTTFVGTIYARGGSNAGNGGFVEVSSKGQLSFAGKVDTRALNGTAGTLLLDPQDVTIGSTGSSVVTVAALQSALSSSNVIVTTGSGTGNGDISVAENVAWSNANSLTLSAIRNIAVNANISNTGGAAINVRADNTGSGIGTVAFGNGITLSTSGAVSIFYNPSVNPVGSVVNTTSYVNPIENYSGNVAGGGTLTAYVLVNTIQDLQNIKNNLSGKYAQGKDINATVTASWNSGGGFSPIGSPTSAFTGTFDGQGHLITSMSIGHIFFAPPATIPATDYVGLFGYVGSTGVVTNVGLSSVAVIAGRNQVGGIAGQNNGTISYSHVDGNVSPSVFYQSTNVGGLVGVNTGTITHSYAYTSATGVTNVGGLVGSNINTGIVNNSYAAGGVTSGSYLNVLPARNAGGLAGQNAGSIVDSYSHSSISGVTNVGGLVGSNTGSIATSYASSAAPGSAGPFAHVQGTTNVGGLVGDNTSGSITSSYWDTTISGRSNAVGAGSSTGATGLTDTQLMAGLPSGLSNTVWGIQPSVSYPYLSWQLNTATLFSAGAAYPNLLWSSVNALPATVLSGGPPPPPPPPPTPTPPTASLPVGTAAFPTQQIADLIRPPINWQMAGSTPMFATSKSDWFANTVTAAQIIINAGSAAGGELAPQFMSKAVGNALGWTDDAISLYNALQTKDPGNVADVLFQIVGTKAIGYGVPYLLGLTGAAAATTGAVAVADFSVSYNIGKVYIAPQIAPVIGQWLFDHGYR